MCNGNVVSTDKNDGFHNMFKSQFPLEFITPEMRGLCQTPDRCTVKMHLQSEVKNIERASWGCNIV